MNTKVSTMSSPFMILSMNTKLTCLQIADVLILDEIQWTFSPHHPHYALPHKHKPILKSSKPDIFET